MKKYYFEQIFLKKLDFQIFFLWFSKWKKFKRKFFKEIFLQTPRFYFQMILNTKNGNYMKVWNSLLYHTQNEKQSNTRCYNSALPPFLGLKDLWNFSDRMCSHITGLPWQSWPKSKSEISIPTFLSTIFNFLDFQLSGVIKIIRTIQALFKIMA